MSEIVWLFGMLGLAGFSGLLLGWDNAPRLDRAFPWFAFANERVVQKTLPAPQEEPDPWSELREFDRALVKHTLENR